MSLRTKFSFAEEILIELRDQNLGREMQIDPREVILKLDQMVNEAAKAGYLENWKLTGSDAISDLFTTSWEWLTITDPSNKAPSYFQLPSYYVDLPDNKGIDQVYFENSFTSTKTKYFDPVIITSFKDRSSYRNTVGEYLEERISCYPKDGVMYFDRGNVGTKYGNVGLRLVVRDSGALADSDPYPIPSNRERYIIDQLIMFYRERLKQPQDNIKDATSVEAKQ